MESTNPKIVTILSGGMDSTTLLYFALEQTTVDRVKVLSFNYGQKHKKELQKAMKICEELGVEHHVVDITTINPLLNSSLTREEQEVPEGHYAEENMKQTVVPNRNAIMLSIAYGYAISQNADYLFYGAHSGDHFIYPDCRNEFVEALDKALKVGNEGFGNVDIVAPFGDGSKSDIVTRGLELGVPYENTWTCYKGGERPCLKCGTCVERTEAFLDNDTKDPLLTDEEWKQAVQILKDAKTSYEG